MKPASQFVARAMTADREQIEALFAECQADALRHAVERIERVSASWQSPACLTKIRDALEAEAVRMEVNKL